MEVYLGTILAFAFNYAPLGWVLCDGSTLAIAQNQALFSLLGTKFGGDGRTTFGVPDLRGRAILGYGAATAKTSAVAWGEVNGSENVTLVVNNMPSHSHPIVNGNGTNGTAKVTTTINTINNTSTSNESDNGSNALGTSGTMPSIFREFSDGTDRIGGVSSSITGTTGASGANSPVSLRNPYLGLTYCIATEGLFPSRS